LDKRDYIVGIPVGSGCMTLDDENYSNLSKILSSAMNDQCQGKEADFMCKMDAMWPMFSSAMSSCTETNRWYNDVE
jgi:hypothetical protein